MAENGAAQEQPQEAPIFGQLKQAGYSDQEIADWRTNQTNEWKEQGLTDADIDGEFRKVAPKQQAALPPPQQRPTPDPLAPYISPPPAQGPGAYDPAHEQEALSAAASIADPVMRNGIVTKLKREFANNAIMDGVTRQAREDAKNTAIASYVKGMEGLRDDKSISYDMRIGLVPELMKRMWNDPRLAEGETKGQLENYLYGLAGLDNPRQLGTGFGAIYHGIVTGQVSTANQILEAGDPQRPGGPILTPSGMKEAFTAFNSKDHPEARATAELQDLAFKRVDDSIFKDLQEQDPVTQQRKPSNKQLHKSNDLRYAILNQVIAAGGDQAKIQKILSPENVDSMIEQVYPWYERRADYIGQGAPVNISGVTVPSYVSQDSQMAYKDIVVAPPVIPNPNKQGQTEAIDPAVWQDRVNLLLAKPTPENIEAFTRIFGVDGNKIIKAIKLSGQPPVVGNRAVVEPANQGTPAEQAFWNAIVSGAAAAR